MTYQRFEDLPVWQEAARLYERVEQLLENVAFSASRGFRDQLDRAALSVSNNIAEGFERGTTNELLAFLYIARGSAGEVRSMLTVKRRGLRAGAADGGLGEIIQAAEACSRQLRGWADSLQNSDIKGQRHLTQKVRDEEARKKRVVEFRKELLRKLPPGHPARREAEERGVL